jgi:hypothetical protein
VNIYAVVFFISIFSYLEELGSGSGRENMLDCVHFRVHNVKESLQDKRAGSWL